MWTKCPKCAYERRPRDEAPEWQCPACKVAYAKVKLPSPPPPVAAMQPTEDEPEVERRDLDARELAQLGRNELAAQGQKILIYSIILNFVLNSAGRGGALPDLVVGLLGFCIAAYSLLGVVRISSGLGRTQNQKILSMVLAFFPLINLVLFIYLSIKATRVLREAGWKVGLLGARP